jgi:hypothetical protein
MLTGGSQVVGGRWKIDTATLRYGEAKAPPGLQLPSGAVTSPDRPGRGWRVRRRYRTRSKRTSLVRPFEA